MYTALIVLYVLVSVALVGFVLIQHGKGADAGAAFGSGASGTVFGARGSANFLSRTTAWLAVVFFALSLGLAYLVRNQQAPVPHSVVETAPAAAKIEIPAPPPAAPKTDIAPAAAPQPKTDTAPPAAQAPQPKTDSAPAAATPQPKTDSVPAAAAAPPAASAPKSATPPK